MKFYGLHEGFYDGVSQRIEVLTRACESLDLEFICIDSLAFDYSNIPVLTKSDLLYNFARGSATLESLLLNDDVTTFYITNPALLSFRTTPDWSIIHHKAGLRSPRTIYQLTTDRALLRKYVEYLRGFPIVLKLRGGTRGIGTIKIESWHSLISTADYLITTGESFMLREFIDAEYGARVVVLGVDVVWSVRFGFEDDDFRNAPTRHSTSYQPLTLHNETRNFCIQAVHSANLEMAGVDILFDREHRPYLLEINFPTGFASFQESADAVLSQMLGHLVTKAQRPAGKPH
jgi:hypothetical protein